MPKPGSAASSGRARESWPDSWPELLHRRAVRILFAVSRIIFFLIFLPFIHASAPDSTDFEAKLEDELKADKVTVVHLWAPWCGNCRRELAEGGWTKFVTSNPDVDVVFVTVWQGEGPDGRAVLEASGLGAQANFRRLVHPNTSRKAADRMSTFLGQRVSWIPSTWIFRKGNLRYALNYGEVRFDVLQTLVDDAGRKW